MFDPRKSEAPTSFSSSFSQYADVLNELKAIYVSNRPNDISNLLDDNGYKFEADSLDSIALGTSLRTWDKAKESQVTTTLLADSMERISEINFSYTEAILYSSPDSVMVTWNYNLVRKDNVKIHGFSDFTLVRRLSRFYLHQWKDRTDQGNQIAKSWGRWKLEHAQ